MLAPAGSGAGSPDNPAEGWKGSGSAWLPDGAPQARLAWTGSQGETEAELESHGSISLDMARHRNKTM